MEFCFSFVCYIEIFMTKLLFETHQCVCVCVLLFSAVSPDILAGIVLNT